MAEERLKAVADDVGSSGRVVGGDGDDNPKVLELGKPLPLRSCFRKEGSSSERERKVHLCPRRDLSRSGLLSHDSPGSWVHRVRDAERDSEAVGLVSGGGGGGDMGFSLPEQAQLERDLQHKRAKVDESEVFKCSSPSSIDMVPSDVYALNVCNVSVALTVSQNENVHIFAPLSNYDGTTICTETTNGIEAGDEPEMRIIEVVDSRMDLTQDLLHLVFSFLGQKDLCKAGVTCKQWRAVSVHEDFWRILNFENT